MNETLIFMENGKLYICKRPAYTSVGFRYSEIWEECKSVPEKLKNTIPRGAAVIETWKGIPYMLWNTADEALGKWFTPFCDGVRFINPEIIPSGFREGLAFIQEKYPSRELGVGRRIYEKSVSVSVKYGKLTVDDFAVKSNKVIENMAHYAEMRKFFALDLYDGIRFKFSIREGEENYKKYSDKNREITIDDILTDKIQGEWKYIGGMGEIIYESE